MKWYDKFGLIVGGLLAVGGVGGIEHGNADIGTGIAICLLGLAMALAVVVRSNLIDE